MNSVNLDDIFVNEGLTLDKESLVIKSGENTLELGTDYKLVETSDAKFSIEFLHKIDRMTTIKYKTTFDYETRLEKTHYYLENKGILTWIDENGEEANKEVVSRFTPDSFTQSNGFKNGNYDAVTKEITWNVGINYNEKLLRNAVVEDYILGNQRLVDGSIEVYKMNLTGGSNGTEKGELVSSDDYSISYPKDEKENKGFRIEFKEEIQSAYYITYKTSLKDLALVNSKYDNRANLYDGGTKETELSASVSIPHGGTYITKDGTQSGKLIDWKVNINFAQSRIVDAIIEDIPSPNQMLLKDSFHLYSTNVDSKGNVTRGEELVRGEDYSLQLKEEPSSFKIVFTKEINEPYILEYQSFIQANVNDTVSNDVHITGKQITPGDITSTKKAVIVKRTAGMGDGTGVLANLKVVKIAASSQEKLQGATFSLVDKQSGVTLKTAVTDDKGEILFDKLLFGDYVLKEDKAPEGYLVGINGEQSITIEKENSEITVQNQKIIRAVQLTKVDMASTDITLAGASFKLLKKVDDKFVELETLTTDGEGKLSKDNLEPGEYQFIETKAPADYQLNGNPIVFTIEKGQAKPLEVVAENSLIPGSVELTKVDADNKNLVLEGAEFSLQDTEGKVLQEGLKTDKDGKIRIEGLKPGKYQLVETKAPAYYQLNSDPIVFTIEKGQEKQLEITAENSLITSSVELTKVDADQQEQYLSGAEFVLQDDKGNILFENLVTNESGKILVENLKPGNYQFVEVKAPKNYNLNKKPVPFTISKSSTAAEVKKVTVIATNELTPGAVELTKVDADKNDLVIGGAEFALQDMEGKNLLEGLITDKDGKIHIDGLKPGKYQLVETKAPAYYQLNSDPIVFTIEKGQGKTLEVKAENSLIPGSVELTKVDADDKNLVLEGAEFVLQDTEGKVLQEGLKTDEDGKILIEGLKPGKYQMVETKAPAYYQLNGKPITFAIEKGQEKVLKVTAENSLITGSVELSKIDADQQDQFLSEAEFVLQDDNGNILFEKLVTNKEGKILVENLKPGNYQFVEVEAPKGYVLNKKPIAFTISKSKTAADVKLVTVSAINELTPGSVELTKVDADNKNLVLEGAEFVLQDTEGKVLQEGLKTDEDGKILIEGLKPGKYQMVETKAPAYYQLNSDPIDFTIEKGQAKTLELMVTNKLILGSAIVKKVDEKTNQPLENAHFKLIDKQGNIIMEEGISGRDGSLELIDLLPGEYFLFETKAPNGYKKLSEPIMFEITQGQQEPIVVKVANEKVVSGEQKPTKESDDESGTKGEDSSGSKNNPGKTLPDTATSYFNYILAGVLLIGFSVLIRIRKRGN